MAPRTPNTSPLLFRYRFRFDDGAEREFVLGLDRETLALAGREGSSPPAWTSLDFHPCPGCPLPPGASHCPIAVNLADVVEFFRARRSFEEVDVTVETEARRYFRRTSTQKGVSSLIGVVMVTSGCPVMDRLRPMVENHLPFMTPEETAYRLLSTYLLAQLFRARRGEPADWDLERLGEFIEPIRRVNMAFCERLTAMGTADASINAVVVLNSLSDFTSFAVGNNQLARLERLFAGR